MAVNAKRLVLVALASAGLGTLLDRIHSFFGVLRYARPCFSGESCWVPLIMAGAGVALVVTHALFRLAFAQPARGSVRAVIASGVLFALAYVASGVFQAWPRALLLSYAVVALIRVAQHPLPARAATVLTAMVVGSGAELVLTHFSLFEYLHPDAFGVPSGSEVSTGSQGSLEPPRRTAGRCWVHGRHWMRSRMRGEQGATISSTLPSGRLDTGRGSARPRVRSTTLPNGTAPAGSPATESRASRLS